MVDRTSPLFHDCIRGQNTYMSHYSISLCQHKIKLKKGLRLCWKTSGAAAFVKRYAEPNITNIWFGNGPTSLQENHLFHEIHPPLILQEILTRFVLKEHFQNSLPTHFLLVETRSSLSNGSFSPLLEPWPTYLCVLREYLPSGGEKIIIAPKKAIILNLLLKN